MKPERMRRAKGTGTLQLERTGFYTIRVCHKGQRFAMTTGTKDRKKAEMMLAAHVAPFIHKDRIEKLQHLQLMIANEEERALLEEEARPQMRLADSWCYYATSLRRKTVSQNTLVGKQRIWEHFRDWVMIVYGPDIELRNVTHEIVETYLRHFKEGHAATTWNNHLCILREIYRILAKPAKAKQNPFSEIPLLPDDSHSRREMTLNELEKILAEASKYGDDWETLFLLAIHTGMRLGDCCKLEWESVRFDKAIIQIIPSKTRNRTSDKIVTIPLHPQVLAILEETPPEERKGYILPQIANSYLTSRHKLSFRLVKIFEDAGITTNVAVEGRTWKVPIATFHSLRHTFVSLAANAGVPLHIIQSIVGHESRAMTWHYYHEDEEALRKAVAAIPTIRITNKETDK